jgi:aspartate aminotransferase
MEILFTSLSKMKDSGFPVDFISPQGGIYLSTRFNLFSTLRVNTNEEIRLWLLNEAGIAVIPFQAFGLEDESGWFRISIGAVSVEEVSAAMVRLENALKNIH